MASAPKDGDLDTWFISGGGRGIGWAMTQWLLARGARVIATARNPTGTPTFEAMRAAAPDKAERLEVLALDVCDQNSIDAVASRLAGRPIDTVVANAGQLNSYGGVDDPDHTADAWRDVLMTNVWGPFALIRALRPNLRAGDGKRAAIIASIMGSTARAAGGGSSGGAYAYRASKAAAVNLAVNLANELKAEGIAVGAYHPGWVRTEMGGPQATLSVEESAATLTPRIAALSLATTGVFEDNFGEPLPY